MSPTRLATWTGVQLAEDITGPYDVIARIHAPSLDQLGRLVVSRIQVVDGVTRTLTCTCSIGSRMTWPPRLELEPPPRCGRARI